MLEKVIDLVRNEPLRVFNGVKTILYIVAGVGIFTLTEGQQALVENLAAVLLFSAAGVGVEVVISEIERSKVSPTHD